MWESAHHHTAKMVSDQHQCCSVGTMLPPPSYHHRWRICPHHTTLSKEWLNTLLLRYFQENSRRVILAAFQHYEGRGCPIQLLHLQQFESFSFIIIIILYLVFIRIRGPSCGFFNFLMKFKNWRERKTCFWMADLVPISSFCQYQLM